MQLPTGILPLFSNAIAEHLEVVSSLQAQGELLESIARRLTATVHAGKKILWCGNGRSAADAQHLAAELIGRFAGSGVPSHACRRVDRSLAPKVSRSASHLLRGHRLILARGGGHAVTRP